jgi:hypothetical protein
LHPDKRLTGVLLLRPSQMLGFALVSASVIGWLVQTAAEPTDAKEHETKGLDTDALILVPMVLDRMPDAKESDAEPQV